MNTFILPMIDLTTGQTRLVDVAAVDIVQVQEDIIKVLVAGTSFLARGNAESLTQALADAGLPASADPKFGKTRIVVRGGVGDMLLLTFAGPKAKRPVKRMAHVETREETLERHMVQSQYDKTHPEPKTVFSDESIPDANLPEVEAE